LELHIKETVKVKYTIKDNIMKSTGRYSEHEEIEMAPEKPFLEDIYKDLARIDEYYNAKTAADIKKKMCAAILGNI